MSSERSQIQAYIEGAVESNNVAGLLGVAAECLLRMAEAQEAQLELMRADLAEQVEAEIQARAETLAEELDTQKSKRSFIGKR